MGRVEALLVSNHEGTPTVHTCQRQKKEKGLSYRKGQGENRWGKLISPTETAALMIMHRMLCYISILPQLKGMTEVNKALLRIQAIGSDRVGDAGPLETRGEVLHWKVTRKSSRSLWYGCLTSLRAY